MIISVAGNISSGKTTLAKKISSLFGFTYIVLCLPTFGQAFVPYFDSLLYTKPLY